MRWTFWTLVLVGTTLAACGNEETREAERGGMGGMAMDSSHMGGAMPMGGGIPGMEMMSGIRAHMDSMMRLPPDRMKAMVATHDQMMAQMLDRMGADMRGMNMAGDRAWNGLTDSIRQDLAALPQLEGKPLADRMRAHADRVGRLMAEHKRMMGSMAKP